MKNDFFKRTQWGEMTFEDIRNDLEPVFWLVHEIIKLPTYVIPADIIQDTISLLSTIKNTFDEIDGFTISQGRKGSANERLSMAYWIAQSLELKRCL